MSDRFTVKGMVLAASPIGENDRRLVILTQELGLISAFCRGAQRQKSTMSAGSRPFTTGSFEVIASRSSYTVVGMDVMNYFDALSYDPEAAAWGIYFMEFAQYYSREGIDGTDQLNLCYLALTALEKDVMPRQLIASVYTLRTMKIAGEYSETPFKKVGAQAEAAWAHVIGAPLGRLFAFTLPEDAIAEFDSAVRALQDHFVDRVFRSLQVLEEIRGALSLT